MTELEQKIYGFLYADILLYLILGCWIRMHWSHAQFSYYNKNGCFKNKLLYILAEHLKVKVITDYQESYNLLNDKESW